MTKKKSEPLLYIHQPDLQIPEADMQDLFLNNGEKQEASMPEETPAQPAEAGGEESPLLKRGGADEPVKSADYFRQSRTTWKSAFPFKPSVPFRELAIPDKIEYLKRVRHSQPPFACEFKTRDQSLLGTLEKDENGIVTIQTFADGEIQIAIDELTGIRLIG